MQFFGKFGKNHMLASPPRVGAPSYGESWIRSCKGLGNTIDICWIIENHWKSVHSVIIPLLVTKKLNPTWRFTNNILGSQVVNFTHLFHLHGGNLSFPCRWRFMRLCWFYKRMEVVSRNLCKYGGSIGVRVTHRSGICFFFQTERMLKRKRFSRKIGYQSEIFLLQIKKKSRWFKRSISLSLLLVEISIRFAYHTQKGVISWD